MGAERESDYWVTDGSGGSPTRSLSAPNRGTAQDDVPRRGIRTVSLSEPGDTPDREAVHGRADLEEFTQFNFFLGSMVRSGLPLDQSLRSVSQDTPSSRMRAVIEAVQADVEGGSSLSAALCKRRDCFAGLYISLVEAGEASGDLGNVLLRVARQSSLLIRVRRRMTEAMIYPSVLAVAAVAIALFLSLAITPTFVAMYEESGVPVPGLTGATLVLFSGPVMVPLASVVTVGLVFLWTVGGRLPLLQRIFDTVCSALPIFSGLLRALALSRFCSALSALLRAGVPLSNALNVVGRTSASPRFRRAVEGVCQSVSEGLPFSYSLRQYPVFVFPRTLCWAVSLGEYQGNLPETLEQAAERYDKQAERYAAALDALLVPAVVLVSGAMVVLFVVVALYPLTSLFVGVHSGA